MENIGEFVVVTDKLQQRLIEGALLADAEQVFCSRVQSFDKETVVDNDDRGVQVIKETILRRPVAAVGSWIA
jgi:hypothetical protein